MEINRGMIFMITVFLAFGFGLFIYFDPQRTFEIQKRFYRMINWHIEPISLQKEIRNTKFMGLFLIFFVIIAVFYFFYKNF